MPFLIIFVAIPLVEVAAFAYIGGEIGIMNTLLFCLLTAGIGGFLVRAQGLATLMKAQTSLRSGQLPMNELFDGFCLVVSGALLLTPGFVTDGLGFALLVPAFRSILKHLVTKHSLFQGSVYTSNTSAPRDNGDIIEGDYESVVKKPETLDRND